MPLARHHTPRAMDTTPMTSTAEGNASTAAGTNPFADVDGDAADDSWRSNLPTVAQVTADPHSLWDERTLSPPWPIEDV